MSVRVRLDVWLAEKGLAQSRTHAQELIQAGQVILNEGNSKKPLKKPSLLVDESFVSKIEIAQGDANRFVSRGGLKLEGALRHLNLHVEGFNVLDVGISTGGFSDCLLQNHANYVLGVDVGHGQVNPGLLKNPQLKVIEGINARALSEESQVLSATPAEKFDLIVMDVSFISISLIFPQLIFFLKTGGHILSLVKPQFEVGVDGLSKGGIVKNTSLYKDVELMVKELCSKQGLKVIDYFSSPIQGKDGNNEFFVYAKKD